MEDRWSIFIPGEPVARAERIVRFNGFSRLADKAPQASYKAYAKTLIAQHAPEVLMDGPLTLTVTAYVTKPKSASKKQLLPDKKPDLSNILKLVEDCLSKIVIVDDARIVAHLNRKFYASDDNKPGVHIIVGRCSNA